MRRMISAFIYFTNIFNIWKGLSNDVMSTLQIISSTSISMDFSTNGYIVCDINIENINIKMKPIDSSKKCNNTTYLICTITMGYTG
jgi:hypothetical protein